MHKTLSRRLAATGVATALAAGALVGATTVSAQAAPVQNTYSCESPLGTFPVVLDSDAPGIEGYTSVPAGLPAPAGILSVTNTFTVPQQVKDQLAGVGVENLSFPDFAGTLGSSSIPVTGITAKVSEMTDSDGDGFWSVVATQGVNEAFETPRAGTYPVLSPAAFTIVADLGGSPVPVACTIAESTDPGSYHTLPVTKNASETAAKVKNDPVNVGERAKLGVTVGGPDFQTPSGKVVVKKGKTTVGTGTLGDTGKDTIKLDRLKRGSHDLVVKYKGDGYTKGSKVPLTLKVRR